MKNITVPNFISILRLIMIPFIFYFLVSREDVIALILLVIAVLTDFLDGQIARRFNQESDLGKILDPAIDRVLIFALLAGLIVRGLVPAFIIVLVLVRELTLVIVIFTLAKYKMGPFQINHIGKTATALFFVAFPMLMLVLFTSGTVSHLINSFAIALIIWGIMLQYLACVFYVYQTYEIVKKEKENN
jgi:cardiolipin synthase